VLAVSTQRHAYSVNGLNWSPKQQL
jgi:hypothetical protein